MIVYMVLLHFEPTDVDKVCVEAVILKSVALFLFAQEFASQGHARYHKKLHPAHCRVMYAIR